MLTRQGLVHFKQMSWPSIRLIVNIYIYNVIVAWGRFLHPLLNNSLDIQTEYIATANFERIG